MGRHNRYACISSDSDDKTRPNRVQKALWAGFESVWLSSRCGAYTVMLIYLLSLLSAGAGGFFWGKQANQLQPLPQETLRNDLKWFGES